MNQNAQLQEYWSNRYLNQSTGWDLGEISKPIQSYVDQLTDKNLKILVPGAGNAYEAEYLFHSRFKNTFIIDISKLPLQNFKRRVKDFPEDQIIQGDFFDLEGQYDLILEQTFFCSFPPINHNREHYARKMHDLLKPTGKLVGLWFDLPLTDDLEKRPFGGSREEYERILSSYFKVQSFERAYNSSPGRESMELFGIFQKK